MGSKRMRLSGSQTMQGNRTIALKMWLRPYRRLAPGCLSLLPETEVLVTKAGSMPSLLRTSAWIATTKMPTGSTCDGRPGARAPGPHRGEAFNFLFRPRALGTRLTSTTACSCKYDCTSPVPTTTYDSVHCNCTMSCSYKCSTAWRHRRSLFCRNLVPALTIVH